MKKLMFAAIVASAMVSFGDVESANICGYQSVTITPAWQIFTFTFKNVGSNAKLDLTDVKPLRADGSAFPTTSRKGGCVGKIKIQKLGSKGAYTTQYAYFSTLTPAGWYDGDTLITKGVVEFDPGEGFAVNNEYQNTDKEAASVLFQVSGEVDLVCKNDIPVAWSINGNSTPVDIDLADVKMLMADGNDFPTTSRKGGCVGKIKIQKLGEKGAYTTQYAYFSTLTPAGWYDGDTLITKGMVPLKAGEGFAINNEYQNTDKEAVAVKIQLPSPIAR